MAKQRWQQIEGPKTIFSVSAAGTLGWMLGTDEGVWKQVGDDCVIVSEALRPAAITAVVVSPRFPVHPVALVGAGDGIARTSDEGQSWQSAMMTQRCQISQIAISPIFHVDGAAFAATMQDGVLCSLDQGRRWQSWNYGLLDLETVALAVSPTFNLDETVVVATVRGLFRSTNAGRAWREVPIPEEALPLSCVAFIGKTLVAGSEAQGLYYSKDLGMSWTKRSSFVSGQINALAVAPDANALAIATPMVVATTTDEGENWVRTDGRVPKGIICMGLGSDGTIACGTQEEGLWLYR